MKGGQCVVRSVLDGLCRALRSAASFQVSSEKAANLLESGGDMLFGLSFLPVAVSGYRTRAHIVSKDQRVVYRAIANHKHAAAPPESFFLFSFFIFCFRLGKYGGLVLEFVGIGRAGQ